MATNTLKFLYSYGGRIVPRPNDGALRYVGGHTRVLSVDRSVTFSELMVKFAESCGSSVELRCKLPSEDLDLLVTIRSEEEMRNLIQEYDRVSPSEKIRAVLFAIQSAAKKVSPPLSPVSCFDFPFPSVPVRQCYNAPPPPPPQCSPSPYRCCSPAVGYPVSGQKYCFYKGTSQISKRYRPPLPPHMNCSRQ